MGLAPAQSGWLPKLAGATKGCTRRSRLLPSGFQGRLSRPCSSTLCALAKNRVMRFFGPLARPVSRYMLFRLSKKMKFHSASRKPFAEEAPVIAVAKQIREQLAQRYDCDPSTPLFSSTGYRPSTTHAIPRSLDIICYGLDEAVRKARGRESGCRDDAVSISSTIETLSCTKRS